jgi:hypothetical protein
MVMGATLKRKFGTGCRKRGLWTPAVHAQALALRQGGATYEQIAEVVGMAPQTVGTNLSGKRYSTTEFAGRIHHQYVQHVQPSARTIDDREQRYAAEAARQETMVARGDLSFLIGDLPPPGRSALDRKRAGL